ETAGFGPQERGRPDRALDPAAGRCEFINAVPARERWAIDQADYAEREAAPGVKLILSDALRADLPADHFDGIFVSNFLEHLASQDETAGFLERMEAALAPGGVIAVMGPNFRYCRREYFDCADHTLVYTRVSVAGPPYAAGLEPERVPPRFLPYSFRSRFPASPRLTRWYLRSRALWPVLGQQFLVIARKPAPLG